MVFFMFTAITLPTSDGSSGPPLTFQIIFPLHALTMLEMFGLLAVYMMHVFKTDRIAQDQKVLWAILIFMGNMIAMPIYWYLHIWKDPPPAPEDTSATTDAAG